MTIPLFVLLVGALLVFGFVSARRQRRSSAESGAGTSDVESVDEWVDLNDKFLTQAKGRSASQIVKVYETFDKDQIRALLDSCGILSYVEFENINSLMPGFGITGYSETYISVLDDDRPEAETVIADYIEQRRIDIQEEMGRQRNLGEHVTNTLLTLDGFRGNLPELQRRAP